MRCSHFSEQPAARLQLNQFNISTRETMVLALFVRVDYSQTFHIRPFHLFHTITLQMSKCNLTFIVTAFLQNESRKETNVLHNSDPEVHRNFFLSSLWFYCRHCLFVACFFDPNLPSQQTSDLFPRNTAHCTLSLSRGSKKQTKGWRTGMKLRSAPFPPGAPVNVRPAEQIHPLFSKGFEMPYQAILRLFRTVTSCCSSFPFHLCFRSSPLMQFKLSECWSVESWEEGCLGVQYVAPLASSTACLIHTNNLPIGCSW